MIDNEMRKNIIVGILPTVKNTHQKDLEQKLVDSNYPDHDPYQDQNYVCNVYLNKMNELGVSTITPYVDSYGFIPENLLDICDCFIIPGGSAINKYHYYVIDYAIKHHKPLLGICMGFQAICIYSSIVDNLKENFTEKEFFDEYRRLKTEHDNRVLYYLGDNNIHGRTFITYEQQEKARHEIKLCDETSRLYRLYNGINPHVVSVHNTAVFGAGGKFKITAMAGDIIEAVEYQNSKDYVMGVQWHPEWDKDNIIYNDLINETIKRKYNLIDSIPKIF